MSKPISGFVFYRGPSMLDGAPIVALLTGLGKASRNSKTGGGLLQTWILREDQSPVDAVHSGADASICGACPHRGTIVDGRNVGRSCYVTVFQAPLVVFKAFQRALYPVVDAATAGTLVAGQMVRLGAYGDPAAVPFLVWQALLAQTTGHAGYTHQWRDFPELAQFTMASCDTAAEQLQAKVLGFRTFRVRGASEPLAAREIVCPASKEAGQKTTCDACKACGGNSAKAKVDVAIFAHGAVGKVNAFAARIAS